MKTLLLLPGAMYLCHLSKAFLSQMGVQINLDVSATYICKVFNLLPFFRVERIKMVRYFRKLENH